MTKAELISEIAISTGYDKRTISIVIESFMDEVKKRVIADEGVYLRGFGSFIAKKRAAKIARNITGNTTVKVPAHRVPAFKAAKEFAQAAR